MNVRIGKIQTVTVFQRFILGQFLYLTNRIVLIKKY